MTRRIKAVVEYDGTDFFGWQVQPDTPTIQGEIEKALEKLLVSPVRISAAGRTDAGVHALGQVVSFTLESTLETGNILKGTNSFLPPSIRLVRVEDVPLEFDPRRDAILRNYRYDVLNRSVAPVYGRRFLSHIPWRLNRSRLDKAVELLKGTHDFSGFRSSDCEAKRTLLTLQTFEVSRNGELLRFDLLCRSFLKNMVRILIGGVIEVSRGKLELSVLEEMLDSGSRDPRVPTAPPAGLTLMKVYYPGEEIRGRKDEG